ncbi:MAG TPA: murein biosynthesis integral membrane protein MurJ [Vicinamibacterales bacterium]|nr:murein biosynthesis integral membrane protein MurJ [Vicinamibacterales bacterium]
MSERLARSAGLIGAATLASRVLGLVRDTVQGRYFGTGLENDAFVVATRIPTLLRDLFAEGAMSAAFVPTVTRYLKQGGKPAAFRLGSQVINGLMVVTGVFVVLGIIFAGPLANLYAGDYANTPGKIELTVQLTRINMPFLLLVAVAAACMGLLNAMRRFFVPASSPALYNIVFIACTVIFVPVFTRAGITPVMALSMGMLLGGVAQIVAQWPLLRREGYRHEWVLNPRDPGLREVLMLMGPGMLGVAAAQINIFVNTSLATSTDGAASALGFAFRFMYMPVGIFGVSIATAAIPDLARHAAGESYDGMRTTLSWGIRLMLMLSVPATVGLMVLSEPIVEAIYRGGRFDEASVRMVASSLAYYAPGIVGYSVVKIAAPSFYALKDARTPIIVSVISVLTNLALNLSLNSVMGFRGLALGTAIAANVNALLLIVLLSRRIGGVDAMRVTRSFLKISLASVVMGVAVYYADASLHGVLPVRLLGSAVIARVTRVAAGVGVGIGALALAAWVLHIEEFRQALQRVLSRITG